MTTEILELIDNHASAIFGIIGTIIGFIGNFILQKWNQKFEVTKEVAKEYYQQKKNVLEKALQLISDNETKIKTLYDFFEDEYGRLVSEVKKEDIYAKYFLLIFEYLHSHRLYLEDETITKLDKLVGFYHSYKLDIKVIVSELNSGDRTNEIASKKEKLFQDTEILFNGLKEEIKFDEIRNFKEKLEQK